MQRNGDSHLSLVIKRGVEAAGLGQVTAIDLYEGQRSQIALGGKKQILQGAAVFFHQMLDQIPSAGPSLQINLCLLLPDNVGDQPLELDLDLHIP